MYLYKTGCILKNLSKCCYANYSKGDSNMMNSKGFLTKQLHAIANTLPPYFHTIIRPVQ